MLLPMADPKRADGTPPAMPDRPLCYDLSGWGEPRRRFARKPAARGAILNESGDFYLLRARHAVCSVACVAAGVIKLHVPSTV
jgi:hypothetical protein